MQVTFNDTCPCGHIDLATADFAAISHGGLGVGVLDVSISGGGVVASPSPGEEEATVSESPPAVPRQASSGVGLTG